jgi:hypothetical protein
MKKLLPEPFDFIANYPLGYYLQSMLVPPPKNVVALCVTPKASSILVVPGKGGAGVFAENISHVIGAPNAEMFDPAVSEESSFDISGPYQKGVVKKYGLNRGGSGVVILDHPRLYLNFHGMQSANVPISEVYAELTRAPQSILPGWQGGETYSWAAVTERLELASEAVYASTLNQLFLTGLPSSLVDFICSWARTTRLTLGGIIPFPVAVAGWAREHYSSDAFFHLVVPTASAMCVFTFIDGKCTHYFAPKNDNYAAGEVAGAIEDVNISSPGGEGGAVYVWPSVGMETEKFMQGMRQAGIRQASVVSPKTEGGLPLAPTMGLCEWALGKIDPGFGGLEGSVSSFDLPAPDNNTIA